MNFLVLIFLNQLLVISGRADTHLCFLRNNYGNIILIRLDTTAHINLFTN